MNSKTLTGVALAAGTFFFMGYVLYELILGDYLAEHSSNDMENVVWWSLIVAQIGLAGLATIGVQWKGAADWMSGAKAAATVGAVYATAYVFDIMATEGLMDGYAAATMWFGETIRFFVAGAALGWFAGRGK